jgi:Fe2+ or Zn2+ uptake regulation protein
MSCGNHLSDEIRKRGHRVTPQRLAILHVLFASGGHLTPGEVYERVHASYPGMNEATVYRTLDFLSENRFVSVTHAGCGRLEYQIAREEHHHLVCRMCGHQENLAHEQIAFFYEKLESLTGYRLLESHLTFTGLCPECKYQQNGG